MRDPRTSSRRYLAFLASAVLVLAAATASAQSDEWMAPARATKRPNPIPTSADSVAKGKAIYMKNCLSCHGETGQGNGPKAKDLDRKPKDLAQVMKGQSDGAIFWKTYEGKKPMPSFEKDLQPDDVWNVINHMRAFGPKR